MSELVNARITEVKDYEQRARELDAQIEALKGQKADIVGSIKSLSSSGVKEITKLSDKAMAELESLLEQIWAEMKKLGELKVEAGKLEKELMYARYFTTGDQAVLKAFPKEVVIAFLDRASSYCLQAKPVKPSGQSA